MTSAFFQLCEPTYIENWPPLLINHSIATYYFPLDPEETHCLLNGKFNDLKALEAKIDEKIQHFPNGVFARLGSRSPKDDYIASKNNFQYHSGKEIIESFWRSKRIVTDILLAKKNNYTPFLVLREWLPIEPWQEFRGFVKGRMLVGLSQYNYIINETFPEIKENEDRIVWSIQMKMEVIKELLPTDDVIIDFIYSNEQFGNEIVNEVKVLELNPFSIYTDPCLFNWSRDTFDKFEFRYL